MIDLQRPKWQLEIIWLAGQLVSIRPYELVWRMLVGINDNDGSPVYLDMLQLIPLWHVVIFVVEDSILCWVSIRPYNCFYNFDNWKDNPGDLWHLRYWLKCWQFRTWIRDNLCCLTFKSDTGEHSHFLRCFSDWYQFQQFSVQCNSRINCQMIKIRHLNHSLIWKKTLSFKKVRQ